MGVAPFGVNQRVMLRSAMRPIPSVRAWAARSTHIWRLPGFAELQHTTTRCIRSGAWRASHRLSTALPSGTKRKATQSISKVYGCGIEPAPLPAKPLDALPELRRDDSMSPEPAVEPVVGSGL